MAFSLFYRRLFERKKTLYHKRLKRELQKLFTSMNSSLREQFMRDLVYAILQHHPTDDLHHYLSDCTTDNFLPILCHLMNYGMLDSVCLYSCTEHVLRRGIYPTQTGRLL